MALSRLATTTALMEEVRLAGWATQDSSSTVKEKVLPGIREDCVAAGMDLAVMQIDKALLAATPDEFVSAMKETESRIYDYLATRTVFIVPASQGDYYDEPLAGWEACIEKFPRSVDHIEEASRCLSLGRNAACVYHLSGVAQEALESLGRNLSVPIDPYSDTWNGLIVKIEKAVRDKAAAMPSKKSWKAQEAFYSEVVLDIKSMKNAWRNPTMHFRRTYTDSQAKKVYQRVQEFMVHASTKLRGGKRV